MRKAVWFVIAAAFTWWAAVAAAIRSPGLEAATTDAGGELTLITTPLADYKTISFNTDGDPERTYNQFLRDLRAHVVADGDERHQIPVLRDPTTVPDSEVFLLVELSNAAEGSSVTLAVNITNLNIEAYRVKHRSYFFRNTAGRAGPLVFTDTTASDTLSVGNTYDDLERAAGESRADIDLGIASLRRAISTLYSTTDQQDRRPRARSLLVVFQMVSEAVRYRYVEARVLRSFGRGAPPFRPDSGMLSFEQNWGRLSEAIQSSNEAGAFEAVQLQSAHYREIYIDNVASVRPYLALMLFVCDQPSPLHSSSGKRRSAAVTMATSMIRPVVAADSTCTPASVKVRITGRDGLCVDVRNDNFSDGNQIQLWPCKSNDDPNQLWEFESDGTIRSNGKYCLTVHGNLQAGQQVVIYDCAAAAAKEATLWHVSDYGTIANLKSGLALSARTSSAGNSAGTTLTVEANDFALSQGWLATNFTRTRVTSIVGFRGLCMSASAGSAVWVEECVTGKVEQQWVPYGDDSLRPNQNRQSCLTAEEHKKGSAIAVRSCGTASSEQRWVFARDGTILNLHSGLVMDVMQGNPSLKKIIAYPPTGQPNQQWLPGL